ncbi:hypothetical protein KW548_06255 [Vibrio neptunius]|uniref:hypothetical protein n=1 Tax=Vibrio neptunius TaxID=170651 RepID=UPI001C5CA3DF|nr:hypothetical protein [Vibrio neptunius]QXX07595.1 hypothetical protein KW548_06255 [Vibrio neptunius]
MKKSKPIAAEIVEFECDECNGGVFRVDHTTEPMDNQWRHTCSNCNREVYLVCPFPYLTYKGEEFILRKYVPVQSPKPSI